MAHTKSAGSTKYGRDSQPKYLGVKKYAGEKVKSGDILIRQRGTHFIPGEGVRIGKDDTIYAISSGVISFKTKRKVHFDGSKGAVKVVSVTSS